MVNARSFNVTPQFLIIAYLLFVPVNFSKELKLTNVYGRETRFYPISHGITGGKESVKYIVGYLLFISKKKIVRIFYLFFFILSTAKVLVQLSRKNVTLFYNSRITCQFTLRICICNSVETIVAIVK